MSLSKNNASTKESNYHDSVLFNEVLKGLNIKSGGIYVDATLGRCGHTQGILNHLDSLGRVIGFDQDIDAIKYAEINFSDPRLELIHSNFSNLNDELNKINLIGKVDGVLMDLGISSPQIDNADRGFSFNKDGLLDMRMNQSQKLTASEIINNFDYDELVKILYDYGEEKFAKKIVREIVKYREEKGKISRTTELAGIVKKAIPKFDSKKNPATKTFQAIRIKVNEELLEIEQVLPAAFEALEKNGRLAVISFHSLEDRIIKNFIKDKLNTDTVPKKIPIFQKQIKSTPIKVIQKLQTPSEGEVLKNKRSRSSKLRVIEKISEEG